MVININDINDDAIRIYSRLTEAQLQRELDDGIIIVESPKVILTALSEGYEPLSLLCERKHIDGDAFSIIKSYPQMPVYTGDRDILAQLTGYKLTRGVLCAMRRKSNPAPELLCKESRYIAVIESVCDTTNIGSIFRSAAALGIDGILLTPDSCDPYNRRSIRVSMGAVFKIPWAFVQSPVDLLKAYGFLNIALALDHDSVPINSISFTRHDRIALFLGTEGDGLSKEIVSRCDIKAIIPMFHEVDSLNVGSAAAVAFWELSRNHFLMK